MRFRVLVILVSDRFRVFSSFNNFGFRVFPSVSECFLVFSSFNNFGFRVFPSVSVFPSFRPGRKTRPQIHNMRSFLLEDFPHAIKFGGVGTFYLNGKFVELWMCGNAKFL